MIVYDELPLMLCLANGCNIALNKETLPLLDPLGDLIQLIAPTLV